MLWYLEEAEELVAAEYNYTSDCIAAVACALDNAYGEGLRDSEMLEALEWAAEWAQESEAGRDDAWWAGLDRVKAAISKAKGKTEE